MTRRSARHCLAVVLVLLVALSAWSVAATSAAAEGAPVEESSPRRLIAIGDIHGAEEAFHAILERVGLVDQRWRWTGGRDVLVQTGDFLDRGADAVRVAERLMDLQKRAIKEGGEVHVLLGNHEIMNLVGDRRDVSPQIVHVLADGASEGRRAVECKARAGFLEKLLAARGEEPPPTRDLRETCVQTTPRGSVEYIRSLAPNGRLGVWLRTLPAALEIEGTLFVHGGVGPALLGRTVEEINHAARQELADVDRWRAWLIESGAMPESATLLEMLRAAMMVLAAPEPVPDAPPDLARLLEIHQSLLMGPDGPFWFRGYAKWDEPTGFEQLPPILDALGAERIVVGHTPQRRGRIEVRFDGRVFLIDTGMLAEVYKGRPAALVIEKGRVRGLYLDGEEGLRPASDFVGETRLETLEDP